MMTRARTPLKPPPEAVEKSASASATSVAGDAVLADIHSLLNSALNDLFSRIEQLGDRPLRDLMAALDISDFNGADLSGADLRGEDLSGISFRGANLSGADLRGCNLRGCDFRDSLLVAASAEGAAIEGASFEGAIVISPKLHLKDDGAAWASDFVRRSSLAEVLRGLVTTFFTGARATDSIRAIESGSPPGKQPAHSAAPSSLAQSGD